MDGNRISLKEAAQRGVSRVRRPIWANPFDHLELDLCGDGFHGPWAHLYAPFNLECNGRDPVDVLSTELDWNAQIYEPYTGPLPESDGYKAAQLRFAGTLDGERS